ncbi:hypothetical protein LB452_13380 [Psychroflexus sp. CAK8W]|uniref:Lipoprotein n=1 Tax=Psychroflexus longus TaxID=2873596 RepID=A0ABS7XPN8_9FLAO|nr:hypothetical protein [Psychroflexus longus]MBZ9779912.1 hypothetical protein [Psychroflexus longus]
MKNTKSILTLIVIFLIVISCGISNTNKKTTLNQYTDLDISIKSYFSQNFKYPDDINTLMNFIEDNKYYKESYDKIIKKGIENFKVSDSSGYFTIHHKKRNILTYPKVNICSTLKDKKPPSLLLYTILAYDDGRKVSFDTYQKKDADSLFMNIAEIFKKYDNSDMNHEYIKVYSDSIYYKCGVKNYNELYIKDVKQVFNNYINKTESDSIKLILPFI